MKSLFLICSVEKKKPQNSLLLWKRSPKYRRENFARPRPLVSSPVTDRDPSTEAKYSKRRYSEVLTTESSLHYKRYSIKSGNDFPLMRYCRDDKRLGIKGDFVKIGFVVTRVSCTNAAATYWLHQSITAVFLRTAPWRKRQLQLMATWTYYFL